MEQLIRSRGVTKVVISRRARLLHNIYAWMRILSESTRVFHEEIPAITLLNVSPNVESTEARQQRLDDFLELEPHKTRGGSGTGSREAPGSSAVDIHMETSHQDLDNLHMQIYGVPETWLRLVSQITRLSNVLDQLSPKTKKSDAELLVSLQPKASYLEDAVCLFKSRHSIEVNNSNAAADETTPHPYMLQALSSALVIFYYRRIKNVNPLVLQDSVNSVIHCLQKFDNALAQRELLGPGTAWPAFIAGAEATGGEQQQQIITWLDNASRKSHWKGYESSKKILMEVWRERAMAGGSQSPTWIDICRRSRQWPLLC
jgi:arginine metabolism regulation protein II